MKAMLLAAGRGARLKPWTDHTPKPLLEVAGKPLIVHHLEHLAAAGFTEIVINVSYLGEQIEQTLGNGKCFDVHIQYSREPAALETGGGILKALPLLGEDPFLVINADIWTDIPLRQLTTKEILLAHIVLVPNPQHNPLGDYYLDTSGKVGQHSFNPSDKDYSETTSQQIPPTDEQPHHPRWTFSGIGIYRPELFKDCQAGKFRLPSVFTHAIALQQITGEIYHGHWFDVGTIERWETLNQFLLNAHSEA